MEARLMSIEKAVIELTVIQRGQTAQTDKIVESMENMSRLVVVSEKNSSDINHISKKLDRATNDISNKEAEMLLLIANNKQNLDRLGSARLWKGLTIAYSGMFLMFGYIYSDVKSIVQNHENTVRHQERVGSFMKHSTKEIDKLTAFVDSLHKSKEFRK